MLNQSNSVISLVDRKDVVYDKSTVSIEPIISVSVIPGPLISVTATKVVEISSVINEIKTITNKKDVVLESISI